MIRHTELIFIESHFYVDICSLFYITIMKICRRGGAGSKQNGTNCSCFRVNTSSFVSSIPSIKATMSLNTSHFHNWAAAIMAVWQHCLAGVAAILHSILLIKWSPKDIAFNLFQMHACMYATASHVNTSKTSPKSRTSFDVNYSVFIHSLALHPVSIWILNFSDCFQTTPTVSRHV